jgi:hypothetical protein
VSRRLHTAQIADVPTTERVEALCALLDDELAAPGASD